MGSYSKEQTTKCVGSVTRSFEILEFLNATERGWNISEISRKLGIPKSTAHMLMSTLGRLGYIQRSEDSLRFELTPKILTIGTNALKCTPLPRLALPHLRWLMQETKLTSHLGILHEDRVVFVQKVEGQGITKIDTYVGKRSSIHCTGVGKAILAFRPVDQVEAILSRSPLGRFTRKTIVSEANFMAELTRIRERGYSIDDEEEELGIRCVAAPVLLSARSVAAVSVTGTTAQIHPDSMERIVSLTKTAAHHISVALTHHLSLPETRSQDFLLVGNG